MKHLETVSKIREGAEAAGVELQRSQAEVLAAHLEMVLAAASQFNLTSVTEPEEALRLHVLDSVAAVPVIRGSPAGPLVDIGSGAGYPGVPIAVATGRHVTLVESNSKKARFLRSAVEALSIEADVVDSRVEELAERSSGAYAIATARAVSSLSSLLELAAPLLSKGGWLVALKAAVGGSELSSAEATAGIVGMRHARTVPLTVPGVDTRNAVVFEKVGEPSTRLPRRPGMAQKRPIG